MGKNKYVSFDWAVKHLLRDKENFEILEGLIEVLLHDKVHITEILESEGNQESEIDKFNRVDIKGKDSKGEIIIVEVQLTRQLYYLERILYGVAKTITEHISLGSKYDQVKKVFSISVVYFDLGHGSDYLYHGQSIFKGVTTGDTLRVTTKEDDAIRMKTPASIFPEYYIIRVRQYNKSEATNYLEEWLEFLRTGNIKDDTQAPGLQAARKNLQYMQMSRADQLAYDRHIDAIMVQNDALSLQLAEGLKEGEAIGLKKGEAIGLKKGEAIGLKKGEAIGLEKGEAIGADKVRRANVLAMKAEGLPIPVISRVTGLSVKEIEQL